MRQRQHGFTLIELIVVIVILAILAAVAMPRMVGLTRDARIAKLNAARGAVTATASLVHATILARSGVADTAVCADGITANNSSGASGTVCTENGTIHVVWGYPDVTGIGTPGLLSAAGLTTVFNPSEVDLAAEGYTYAATANVATFGVVGAPTPATCFFTYTEASGPNRAAEISAVTTTGC
ncbi:MAG: ral secretion pathway protein [Proteobacteria bacterium]|nr:ral secretion pathway protein [Pseudomonadota bacterium]